ncbi:hypothetical protein [Haloferula helveola]
MKSSIIHSARLLPMILALATKAWAAVVYSGIQDIPIPTTFDGVYLDIITETATEPSPSSGTADPAGDTFTISYSEPAEWDVNFFFGGLGIAHSPTFNPYRDDAADILSPIHNLGLNTYIDGGTATAPAPGDPPLPAGGSNPLTTPSYGGSGDSSGSSATNHVGSNAFQFQSGTEGYIAFVLDNGGTTYNGWMRVTLTDDGTPGTIHDWAYDTDPILIGAIPEPGVASLALVGALFAVTRRRRSTGRPRTS